MRHRRGGEDLPLKRYHYGLRICPEPVYWGGLSGSPYSEAVSWGKFVPPAEGGKFGEVFVDATVGLPLIVAAVLERLKKKPAEKKAVDSDRKVETRPESLCGQRPSQSKISTADAITVVHKPRLSPTADCVTLAVRTILFEMR